MDMKFIVNWRGLGIFAGSVVAFRARDNYFYERYRSIFDSSVSFGYIHPKSRWYLDNGGALKGYALSVLYFMDHDRLITKEPFFVTDKELIYDRKSSLRLSVRFANKKELLEISGSIAKCVAKFEYFFDQYVQSHMGYEQVEAILRRQMDLV
jgi:hypothetical protein